MRETESAQAGTTHPKRRQSLEGELLPIIPSVESHQLCSISHGKTEQVPQARIYRKRGTGEQMMTENWRAGWRACQEGLRLPGLRIVWAELKTRNLRYLGPREGGNASKGKGRALAGGPGKDTCYPRACPGVGEGSSRGLSLTEGGQRPA